MRVLVFGDSITYGAWDTEGGWVDRLKRDAHRQTVEAQGSKKTQIINLGIGGNSSTRILERMPAEIEARYSPSWPFVLVFSFGANDERSRDGIPETSIEQFETNVRSILKLAHLRTGKILFVGAPPIGKPVIDFKGVEYSDERLREYEARLQTIVAEAYVPFVPIRPVFEQAGLDKLFSYDHIHPNDEGHKLIAETVKPKLWELLS